MPVITQRLPVRSYTAQAGFSLVEILVGLVISLLVTLAIMQVFSVFEGQKRSTMGTADAQTNGNIAIFNIQRDMQMAGYGLPVFDDESPLKCTNVGMAYSPVVIVDGGVGAGASDTVTVRKGSSATGGVPVKIDAVSNPLDPTYPNARMLAVVNNMGCHVGDEALVFEGTSCALFQGDGTGNHGVVTSFGLPLIPKDTTHIELRDVRRPDGTVDPIVANGAKVACITSWTEITYAVNNNQLESNGVPNVAEIVNMQAQYGVSAAPDDNIITQWVDATGATWQKETMTVTNRNRIKAVRIAIVARNGLLEKENVTTACSSRTTADPTGLCAWDATTANPLIASPAPAIDLSKNTDGTDNPDWQKYRYRVYEVIIPIRSMIWARKAL